MPGVLIADDAEALTAVASVLTADGVGVSRATSTTAAFASLEDEAFDCVVATPEATDTDGISVLRRARELDPAISAVLIVDDGQTAVLNRAHAAGIHHILGSAEESEVAGRIQDIVASSQVARKLDRYEQLETAVRDATRALVTAEGRRAIEQTVCERLVQSGRYSVAWISDYVEETNTLEPRTAAGIELAHLRERPVADDLESVAEVSVRATGENGPPTTVTVTLVHDEQLHGVLQLTTARSVDSTERDLLTTLGTATATAMHRAAHPTDSRPALELFSGVLSHELRNGLQTAHSHLDLAAADASVDHLGGVKTALERVERLADEAAVVARQDVRPEDRSSRDFGDSASAAWDRVHAPDCSMTVVETGPIEAHQSLLETILENLFRNSVEHGGDTILVSTVDDGFYVEDSGPGIPSGETDDVFEWGFTTSDEGSGLGLAVVDRIVDAHGWSIRVTNADGGTRFSITGV